MKKTIFALALSLGVALTSNAMAAEKTLAEQHAGMWPKSENGFVTKNQCLKCHGPYEKLAEKTANLDPNPHFNHMGAVNCEDCHKADKPAKQPELMCNSCHQFTVKAKQAQK